MDLSKLFSLQYLFRVQPGEFHNMTTFIALFLLMIVGSFYVETWMRRNPNNKALKRILGNFPGQLRNLGIIGFLLLWFRYENIPYLAMRAFLLALLIYILWVIGSAIHTYRTKLDEAAAQFKKRVQKAHDPYLPRQKKKRKKGRR